MNRRTTAIEIHSDSCRINIRTNDSIPRWFETPVKIRVPRSQQDLFLFAKSDSAIKQICIRSKFSLAYTMGNLFTFGVIGWVVDHIDSKGYTYPSYITLHCNKSGNAIEDKYSTGLTNAKKLLYLT
jgi:hypothetical protein